MVLPLVLLLTLASLVVEPVVIAMTTAPYSPWSQAISDLGATSCGVLPSTSGEVEVCSPGWVLMNAGMAVSGVALVVSAVLLRRRFAASRGAAAAVVVAGVSTVGAAVVPLDVSAAGHVVVALPAFPAQAVAMFLLAGTVGRALGGRWRVGFLVGGVVTAVATALFVAPTSWGVPFGAVERVAAYLLPLGLAAVAAALVVRRESMDAARTD
ncbi:DUF998 domain-containing protein [Rhodococcoides corynebacterioides]|uniref:DUF998 domain-containing protein n=1 Tax=Rhodococcoides corynebacterioides TaxID=53972 RepID=UPI001C9AAC7A|nr:DUF998 domain-containing protein [Rhodococcus corynebacterioides]MBY6352040.1 DUF998 domain-containing protein [Rhodococcus corynebacterioides]